MTVILASDSSLIFNGIATITVTLPDPTTCHGRWLYKKNITAFAVVSDASNVVPLGSTTPGTAILPATVGSWAWLQSDGTDWIVMAASQPDVDIVAPITVSGSYTVTATDRSLIASGATSLTLPTPSSCPGRWLNVKNTVASAVTSASSNVCPLGSTTPGTAILTANAGRWAALQSDGTHWIIMMGVV